MPNYTPGPPTGTFATVNLDNLSGSNAANVALNMNSHKVTGVVDPTALQDAATKNYVDNISPPAGANRFLSNLLSPVEINQDLNPLTNARKIGDLSNPANIWNSVNSRDAFFSSAGGNFFAQLGNTVPVAVNNSAIPLFMMAGSVTIGTFDRDDGGLSGNVTLSSGNSTNISGNTLITTGTAGSTRGKVLFGAIQNHQQNTSEKVVWEYGVTGARPAGAINGQRFFDSTLGKPIWYHAGNWVDATGAVV